MYCMPENTLRRLVEHHGSKVICQGRRGIEKESLRVSRADGSLALTDHPPALGSALTHPFITTDFAESLLEFVTPALTDNTRAIRFLEDLHRFTLEHLQGETLWPCSMPCGFANDARIPLARYGPSNIGQMKTVYRRGLGLRYGRVMQTIAGVHFNYSLPRELWPLLRELSGEKHNAREFQNACYFALVRNFKRVSWLILYLFGSSPAVCKSFFQGASGGLEELDDMTAGGRYATSLRMSDIGYSNNAQSSLNISVNSLDEYVAGLVRAISTPHAPYEKIGLYEGDKRLQISTNILQISNEFYSVVRPKRVARSGEKPTVALRTRGVEYVEIRSLDIDPFAPVGVNQKQLDFVECLLIHCALTSSPAISPVEQVDIATNDNLVALRGREPGLLLQRGGATIAMHDWAQRILEQVVEVAEYLDTQQSDTRYQDAVEHQLDVVNTLDATPSARVLQALHDDDVSYHEFGMRCASANSSYLQEHTQLSAQTRESLVDISQQSHQKAREVEAADSGSFEDYLARFFAQTSSGK
ncbi:MAG: glutamate--cysteine ligase [Gammaproteobacteria bacterium]|nr:glutamate--cysteine ligase [Gammaproteobacteria bacterium]